MSWDDDLSPEQRAYASDSSSILRLVAGPGTGKTRVMTRRVAYLIEQAGVEPERILALTFSRAAAREIRQRVDDVLGEGLDRPNVYTLHAFALRQLLRNQGAPTLPHPIRIADDYDERWVVQEEIAALANMKVREVQKEFRNLAADWETLKADEDEWDRQHPNPRFLGAWRRHREIYGYTLRSELVYALKKALDEDPDLELEPRFDHILADEYQDLNRCELAVVERLVGDGERTLFAAGDDDQSIYGFRNAFPLGLREFGATYPDATEGELVECHRCDRDILAMALNVAEQDVDRIPKALSPLETAEDGQVEAHSFGSISQEARGIAEICRTLIDDGELEAGEILILLRSDPHGIYSAPIIEALAGRDIEAELPSDPFSILAEDMPRGLVCVLRLLRDRDDGLAWRELLKLRDNGLGDGSLMAIYRLADELGERYYPTLQTIADNPDTLDHARRTSVANDVVAIEAMLDRLDGVLDDEASEGLTAVLDEIEFPPGDDRDAVEDLLLGLVVDSDSDSDDPTLGDVEVALHSSRGSMDEAERAGDPNRVQIMSMHSAKGLTAEAVIVAACDDELIPGDTENRRELDDQRRLLYVSLTRAKHYLFLTYARRRAGRQSHMLSVAEKRTYTRFLRDYLPPHTH